MENWDLNVFNCQNRVKSKTVFLFFESVTSDALSILRACVQVTCQPTLEMNKTLPKLLNQATSQPTLEMINILPKLLDPSSSVSPTRRVLQHQLLPWTDCGLCITRRRWCNFVEACDLPSKVNNSDGLPKRM